MTKRIFWLASYPKSGNTWIRSVLSVVQNNGHDRGLSINELNSDRIASSRLLLDDALGLSTMELTAQEIDCLRPKAYEWISDAQSTYSYHKIHDACRHVSSGKLLVSEQATAGVLYLVRNPLDVAVSYANHMATSIDETIEKMSDPDHGLAPFTGRNGHKQVHQTLLTWSDHVTSWIDNPNLVTRILRYEDMLATPETSFSGAFEFLNVGVTADKLRKALTDSCFQNLKAQEAKEGFREAPPTAVGFFRKGIAGDWQTELSAAQVERVISDHGDVMVRLGYLDPDGAPRVM